MNKSELQYNHDYYSIAIMSAFLLALTHVSNLVVTTVWFLRRSYAMPYIDINTPSPADSGRIVGRERGAAAEAKQA